MSEVVYRINRPEVIHEQFEDEYVVVNLKTGSYYSLSGSAPVVWDAIGNGATEPEILQTVSSSYTLALSSIQSQVQEVLKSMQDEELVVGESIPADSRPPRQPLAPAPEGAQFFLPVVEKYTDMQELLLLDPIQQVDETGWPARLPDAQ